MLLITRINRHALKEPNNFSKAPKLSHQFINNSIEFILCGPFSEQKQHSLTASWVVYYIVGLLPILQVRKCFLMIIDIVMANVLISIIIKILVTQLWLLFLFHLDNKMGHLMIPETYWFNCCLPGGKIWSLTLCIRAQTMWC